MITREYIEQMQREAGIKTTTNPTGIKQSTVDPNKLYGVDLSNYIRSIGMEAPEDPSKSHGYLQKWADIPGRVVEGYKGAINTAKEGISAGANLIGKGKAEMGVAFEQNKDYSFGDRIKDFAGGALKVAGGTLRAGFGGAQAAQGAIFAPVGAITDAVVPDTGNEWIDKGVEGLAQGYAGGGWNAKGLLTGVGINEAFFAKQKFDQSEGGKAFRAEHPDLAPIIDGALSLGLAAWGDKVQRDIGAEKGQPGIFDTPISEVPGRIGQNLLSGPRALAPYVSGAAEYVQGGIDKLEERWRNMKDFDGMTADGKKMPAPSSAGERIADNMLDDPIKDLIRRTPDDQLDALQEDLRTMAEEARAGKNNPSGRAALHEQVAREEFEPALESLNDQISEQGERARTAMQGAAEEVIPQVPSVNSKFTDSVTERFGGVFEEITDAQGVPTGKYALVDAPGRTLNITNSERALYERVYPDLLKLQANPTAQNAADIIDKVQGIVYAGKHNVAEPARGSVLSLLNEYQHDLNSSVKPVVDAMGDGAEYSDANAKMSELYDVRDRLNSALGTDYSKGGSILRRAVLSPSDSGLKELIADVSRLTGRSIAERAQLAQWVMEKVAQDPRGGKGLLGYMQEGVELLKHPTQIPGAIGGKILEAGMDHVIDPETMLNDYINMRRGATAPEPGGTEGEGGSYSQGFTKDDKGDTIGDMTNTKVPPYGKYEGRFEIEGNSKEGYSIYDTETNRGHSPFKSIAEAEAYMDEVASEPVDSGPIVNPKVVKAQHDLDQVYNLQGEERLDAASKFLDDHGNKYLGAVERNNLRVALEEGNVDKVDEYLGVAEEKLADLQSGDFSKGDDGSNQSNKIATRLAEKFGIPKSYARDLVDRVYDGDGEYSDRDYRYLAYVKSSLKSAGLIDTPIDGSDGKHLGLPSDERSPEPDLGAGNGDDDMQGKDTAAITDSTGVTKDDFKAYLKVQKGGKFNMIAESQQAAEAAGLDRDTYMSIIKNYEDLTDAFGGDYSKSDMSDETRELFRRMEEGVKPRDAAERKFRSEMSKENAKLENEYGGKGYTEDDLKTGNRSTLNRASNADLKMMLKKFTNIKQIGKVQAEISLRRANGSWTTSSPKVKAR